MTKYAQGTEVDVDRSRLELERTLRRFGADQFASAWASNPERYMVAFRMSGRQIRLDLPMPDPDDPEFRLTGTGRVRATSAAREAYQAEVRRRWRSLLLVVKAKLTAVADGISTLEREFLADVVLPSGETLGERLAPQIEATYATGSVPALLPAPGGAR